MARQYGIRPWELEQLTPDELRVFRAHLQSLIDESKG